MLLSLAKQIHPPITSAGFAAGGSVLDHRFGKGDAHTLSVEEEYMLLAAACVDAADGGGGDPALGAAAPVPRLRRVRGGAV
jgi:hypothetical protein